MLLYYVRQNWKMNGGTPNTGDDKYDLWMKNRSDKGGGGVIIMTKKS